VSVSDAAGTDALPTPTPVESAAARRFPPVPSPPGIALPELEEPTPQESSDRWTPSVAAVASGGTRASTTSAIDGRGPDRRDATAILPSADPVASTAFSESLIAADLTTAEPSSRRRGKAAPLASLTPYTPTPARAGFDLQLPTDMQPIENKRAHRIWEQRQAFLEEPGGNEAAEDIVGTLEGFVTSAVSGEPLEGAEVRLVVPDAEPVTAHSDAEGAYVLQVPTVPDFFALSASLDGYVPASANVEAARLIGTTLWVDFELHPKTEDVIAVEPVPDVHHLGDNAFDGRINSRFQKRAEGDDYVAEFDLAASQLAGRIRYAEVRMLAKGVQRRHPIRINGYLLDRALDDAPSDGSFGEFVTRFDPEFLQAGPNLFHLHATARGSDIDDFEFVNVRIRLVR
jgi:hypothetical protein